MVLSLPPIPPELRPITPHLQRADELAKNDPVISYWCAYYAAQQGIALKLKDSAARRFLFELLGLLERMKTDLESNDAVHDEAASIAYIENFALRVFAGADNEDRSGNITRNTARKFLAASNFLELLHIFDSDKGAIDIPSIDEKIKYAKWKAADISKALREGRKPTAGPVGSAADETLVAAADLPDLNMVPPPITPPSASFPLPSKQSSPSIRPTSPPQLTNLSQADHHQLGAHLPDGLAPPLPPQSPGNWSTIATPGTPGFHLQDGINYASLPGGVPPGSGGRTRKAYVSGELEGKSEEDIDAEITPPASAERSVHFSPSVVGGLETPGLGGPEEDPFSVQVVVNPSIQPQPSAPPFEGHPAYSSAPEYPYAAGPQPSSQSVPSAWPVRPPPPTMPSPSASNTHPPPVTSPASDIATSTITITPAELTPQVVSRVQKHCKYAISALDYEDAEQAIKELRTALRMLGG